jgi:hypothetical protein
MKRTEVKLLRNILTHLVQHIRREENGEITINLAANGKYKMMPGAADYLRDVDFLKHVNVEQ